MIKVNVVQELDEKRESNIKEADSFVEEIKSLMAFDAQKEKENLVNIGLDFQVAIVEKKTGIDLERKKFEQELGAKTFTESEVREFCLKYDLRLLPTKSYVGTIDPSVGTDLTKFLERNNIESRHMRDQWYIMAPPNAFKLANRPVPVKPRHVDPVLFLKVTPKATTSDGLDPYYVLVKKWGNDFTIARAISGWVKRDPINSAITGVVTGGAVLSLITGAIFGPHAMLWAAPASIAIAAIVSLVYNGSIDGEPKGFNASKKRYNVGKWNTNFK